VDAESRELLEQLGAWAGGWRRWAVLR